MRVGICDDERAQRESLSALVRKWDGEAEIALFERAEAFMGSHTDIALLDVEMPGADGVTLARALRAQNDDMELIFVSAYPEYAVAGYEVRALRYLVKPVSEGALFAALGAARERLRGRELLLRTQAGAVRINARDIRFVEAFAHEADVHADTVVRAAQPMGELRALLGDAFFACHRSYLVNLDHVRALEKDAFRLDDGSLVPVARGKKDEAARAFIRHHRTRKDG